MVKKVSPPTRIRILRDHDWPVPGKRAWVAFRAGSVIYATRTQADDLVARGVAEIVK